MAGAGWPGDVGVTGQRMENENRIGFVFIELAEDFIGQSNVGDCVAAFRRERTYLTKQAISQRVAITPRTGHRWCPPEGCLQGLRHKRRRH
jgi:hypothetical protein